MREKVVDLIPVYFLKESQDEILDWSELFRIFWQFQICDVSCCYPYKNRNYFGYIYVYLKRYMLELAPGIIRNMLRIC